MFVKSRMTRHTLSVTPETSLAHAADIMQRHNFEGLPVLEGGKLVGVVTMWDIAQSALREAGEEFLRATPVSKVMSRRVLTIGEDEIIEEAAYLMHRHRVDILPVVDAGGELAGVITEPDIFGVFVEMLGLTEPGTRIAMQVEDRVGQLAQITAIIRRHNVSIAHVATLSPGRALVDVVVRLKTTAAQLIKAIVDDLRGAGFRVVHVSQVWED